MSLWNWLVPSLFRGPALQYWQAVGLLLLSRILFGSLRGRGGWHGHWRARMWRERWASMTPQERERFRERFQHRCGHRVEPARSEEHTSELQSQSNLVCRLLLEKKKIITDSSIHIQHSSLM